MIKAVCLLLTFLIGQASADWCYYSDNVFKTYCSGSCCTYGIYAPCCSDVYTVYATTPFIAGITCGGITLIVVCFVVILLVRRRRRLLATTTMIRNQQPGNTQVFSTTSTSSIPGYGNPQYGNPQFGSQQYGNPPAYGNARAY
jgi:hypothetical protein